MILFRKQIEEIDRDFHKHMDTNIRIFYKFTPEQTRSMKLTDKKQLYIDLLYYNKANNEK